MKAVYVREGVVEQEKNEKRKSKIRSVLIAELGIYWNPGMSAQSCVPLCFGHKVISLLPWVLLLPPSSCFKSVDERQIDKEDLNKSWESCMQEDPLHFPSPYKQELCWGRRILKMQNWNSSEAAHVHKSGMLWKKCTGTVKKKKGKKREVYVYMYLPLF